MTSRDSITELLRSRIRRGVHAGALRPGDRLPSARQYASEFEVDFRVVLAAYRALAEDGVVEMRPRGGVYVAPRQGAGASLGLPEGWICDVLAAGVAREIPITELHEWLRRCVETRRLRAGVIARTADQAAGICRELRDDFALAATPISPRSINEPAEVPLDARRADILITTEAFAGAVRALGERLGTPVVVISVRPDLIGGEWRLLLRRPVYLIVHDERFGEIVRQFFVETPGRENLRLLIAGRDDLQAIPEDAPTYVTRSARERLRGTRIPGRLLPAARLLAPESANELIGLIVRANLQALSGSLR